jgi:hypothetical protein
MHVHVITAIIMDMDTGEEKSLDEGYMQYSNKQNQFNH